MILLIELATLSAFAAPAAPVTSMPALGTGHVRIDLFEDDLSPDKPDWDAARRGPWTKPYIGWTIDAGQGDSIVEFGDVRFRDEVITGNESIDVVMTIRINGIDDYDWTYWDEEVNLRLASQPKDASYISSDPSTRVWEDLLGFYVWDHEITNLKIVGLPYSMETLIEVIFMGVVGTHDSMAPHRLTHCVGSVIVPGEEVLCGGTDLKLLPFGGVTFRPFPSAPDVATTATEPEDNDTSPEELFQQLLPTAPTRGVEGRFDKADVPGPK